MIIPKGYNRSPIQVLKSAQQIVSTCQEEFWKNPDQQYDHDGKNHDNG
jgi:hypothetical protein